MLPTLSLETSGDNCSVGILFENSVFFETNVRKKNIHSEILLSSVELIAKLAKIQINDVKSISVSIGPGSFTGLRVGLAAAKGIAYGIGIPILPVPTFDALALQISDQLKQNSSFAIVNKANADEVYFGQYLSKIGNYECLQDIKVIKSNELQDEIAKFDYVFGNYNPSNRFNLLSSPNAFYIANWAYIFGKDLLTFDLDLMEPIYIKKFTIKEKK
jgi:tRNA threonylcarbamoyladenosine biosynthesis protein TsaB